MKKLLGISLVAVLAATPLMANAAAGDVNKSPASYTTQPTGDAKAGVMAGAPLYQLATADATTDGNAASAGYVKGAYNAAIKAVNTVADDLATVKSTANGAVQTVKVNGTALTETSGAVDVKIEESTNNGKIKVNDVDVAVHGLGSAAYTSSGAYATSAQGTKAENAVQGVKVNGTALTEDANHDVNITVTTGDSTSGNGTIKVNGAGVAVYGLGSAAYTDSGAYATSDQGTKAESAVQGVKVNGAALTEDANHDVNITIASGTSAGTIKVNGTDVAVTGVLTGDSYAKKTGVVQTIKNTELTQGAVTQGLTGAVSGTTATVAKIMTEWGSTTSMTNVNALTSVSNGTLATNVSVAAPTVKASSVVYAEPAS